MRGVFFRVDGADLETGEETYLVLEAATVEEAESVARKQGLLIAAVRTATPADWSAPPGVKVPIPPPPRPAAKTIVFGNATVADASPAKTIAAPARAEERAISIAPSVLLAAVDHPPASPISIGDEVPPAPPAVTFAPATASDQSNDLRTVTAGDVSAVDIQPTGGDTTTMAETSKPPVPESTSSAAAPATSSGNSASRPLPLTPVPVISTVKPPIRSSQAGVQIGPLRSPGSSGTRGPGALAETTTSRLPGKTVFADAPLSAEVALWMAARPMSSQPKSTPVTLVTESSKTRPVEKDAVATTAKHPSAVPEQPAPQAEKPTADKPDAEKLAPQVNQSEPLPKTEPSIPAMTADLEASPNVEPAPAPRAMESEPPAVISSIEQPEQTGSASSQQAEPARVMAGKIEPAPANTPEMMEAQANASNTTAENPPQVGGRPAEVGPETLATPLTPSNVISVTAKPVLVPKSGTPSTTQRIAAALNSSQSPRPANRPARGGIIPPRPPGFIPPPARQPGLPAGAAAPKPALPRRVVTAVTKGTVRLTPATPVRRLPPPIPAALTQGTASPVSKAAVEIQSTAAPAEAALETPIPAEPAHPSVLTPQDASAPAPALDIVDQDTVAERPASVQPEPAEDLFSQAPSPTTAATAVMPPIIGPEDKEERDGRPDGQEEGGSSNRASLAALETAVDLFEPLREETDSPLASPLIAEPEEGEAAVSAVFDEPSQTLETPAPTGELPAAPEQNTTASVASAVAESVSAAQAASIAPVETAAEAGGVEAAESDIETLDEASMLEPAVPAAPAASLIHAETPTAVPEARAAVSARSAAPPATGVSSLLLYVFFPFVLVVTFSGLGVMIYGLLRSAPSEAVADPMGRLEFRVEVLSQMVLGGMLAVVGVLLFVGASLAMVAGAMKSRSRRGVWRWADSCLPARDDAF